MTTCSDIGHRVNTFTGVCLHCGWQAQHPPIDAVIAHFKRLDEAIKSTQAGIGIMAEGLAAASERLQADLGRMKTKESGTDDEH